MRILFWILLIFALAVGLTLAGKFDPGYAILVYPPYRVELSLTLLLILLFCLIIIGNLVVRVSNATFKLPQQAREFRRQRQIRQGQKALMAAVNDFVAQQYPQAEAHAVRALALEASPHLSAMIAARAAEAQHAFSRQQEYLTIANRHSPDNYN